MTESGIAKVTKRFVMCLLGLAFLLSLGHAWTQWAWPAMEAVYTMPGASAVEVKDVSQTYINSLTIITAALVAGVVGIGWYFVSGNAKVLTESIRYNASIGALASAASQHISETVNQKTEVDETLVHEFAELYKDDPSYIRPEQLPDR